MLRLCTLFVPLLLPFVAGAVGSVPAGEEVAEGQTAEPVFTQDLGGLSEFRIILAAKSRLHLQFPDTLIGRPMSLFVSVLEAPPPNLKKPSKFGYAGDRFGPVILRLIPDGDEIRLEHALGAAAPGSDSIPIAACYNERQTWGVVAWFPRVPAPKGSVAFDATDWLHDDSAFGLSPFFFTLNIGARNDAESHISEIITLPGQLIVRSDNVYGPSMMPGVRPSAGRWRLGASICLLRTDPSISRQKDSRVGFFSLPAAAPAGKTLTAMSYIKRWRLRVAPKDSARYAAGEKVEPVEKIRFCIAPDFDRRFLPCVRKAVANWLPAFEEAGFRNAVEVVELPQAPENSLDNARINWIQNKPTPIENAYGHGYFDLRTGEIISAHIGIYDSVSMLTRRWYIAQTGDTARQLPEGVEESLFEMVLTHEIGHVLGLEHNYYGSALYGTAQLRDRALMRQTGHGSSIMDYMRLNYAVQPEDGFEPLERIPGVGIYDRAAIAWGYRVFPSSARDTLATLAATYARRAETRYGIQSNKDIQAQAEDLGRNPLETAELGMLHLQRVSEALRHPTDDTADAVQIRKALDAQYGEYVGQAISYLGGYIHTYAEPVGHIQPLDITEQRKALDFLRRYVVEPPEWLEEPVYAPCRQDMAGRLVRQLEYVAACAVQHGGDYTPEMYLDDVERLLLGDDLCEEPAPEREILNDRYVEALKTLYDDPNTALRIRLLVRNRLKDCCRRTQSAATPFRTAWRKRIEGMLDHKNTES